MRYPAVFGSESAFHVSVTLVVDCPRATIPPRSSPATIANAYRQNRASIKLLVVLGYNGETSVRQLPLLKLEITRAARGAYLSLFFPLLQTNSQAQYRDSPALFHLVTRLFPFSHPPHSRASLATGQFYASKVIIRDVLPGIPALRPLEASLFSSS